MSASRCDKRSLISTSLALLWILIVFLYGSTIITFMKVESLLQSWLGVAPSKITAQEIHYMVREFEDHQ